jgi:hypothetical protein
VVLEQSTYLYTGKAHDYLSRMTNVHEGDRRSLDISEKTAEFHKHHIMKAFNLESNAALILFALKQGLISLPKGSMKRA